MFLIKHIYKGVSLGSILILLSLLRENALFAYFWRLFMNELEEKYYSNIKEELVQSVIDKKIDTYIANRNELSHYYNVGKMIIDAQGGEERAKYGNGLIRKFSLRLTKELGKGYDTTTLKRMRRFFLLIKKGATLWHQLSWSHYRELLSLEDC